MAEFDIHTRKVISDRLQEQRNKRIKKLGGRERALAEEIIYQYYGSKEQIDRRIHDIQPDDLFNHVFMKKQCRKSDSEQDHCRNLIHICP